MKPKQKKKPIKAWMVKWHGWSAFSRIEVCRFKKDAEDEVKNYPRLQGKIVRIEIREI